VAGVPTRAAAVVVAAGASSRMGGIDKLTAPVAGRPLLAWTLAGLDRTGIVDRLIVVAAADRVDEVRAAAWLPPGATVVAGGSRRQESVAAGIATLERGGSTESRVVLVHDGARPVITADVVKRVVEAAATFGAAVPVVPVVETLKRVVRDAIEGTVDRTGLAVAQTPQGVRLGILRRAYERFPPDGPTEFTDEAALLEACTIPVRVVPGHVDNLKVTLPADLPRAAALLGPSVLRIGVGEDAHPFGPGEPLMLGGVEVSGVARLFGHSDGDVLLHAVADALLGAAGLGDLGRLFPADDRTPEGVASSELLAGVVERLATAGARPVSLDVTVVAARPHLAARLEDIRSRVAALVGLPVDDVNVKASTGNLIGFEGAGRGISVRAVASVQVRR
jgi:2-C-methyl-D-erythritol 4-phosphate cytidylyltransferase/2-C-methyl-D-erythritol 2,4-cyclodiphosphate synthase